MRESDCSPTDPAPPVRVCSARRGKEIAAGAGLSLAETRQAVATLVAKGVLVVRPGGPLDEPQYALNLVRRSALLRIDR